LDVVNPGLAFAVHAALADGAPIAVPYQG
jgi:hypothetical protein